MAKKDNLGELVQRVSDVHNADLLVCNSPMDRGVEAQVVDLCRGRKRRDNVFLLLVTSGGDADVAFRIARWLQCSYKKFTCAIPGWCKSAGTLVTLGANEVVFGVHGELGPLDVQMAKKDEMLDVESGLTVRDALTAIHENTFQAFEHFFMETTFRAGGRLSAQTASEIAVGLTTGLFAPISEQIDPIHIGESYRSMAIATEYGQRLIDTSKNTKPSGLNKIITGYPSHGFVIDRLEAETVFENVRESSPDEQQMFDSLGNTILHPYPKRWIMFLSTEVKEPQENDSTKAEKDKGNDYAPEGTGGNAPADDSNEQVEETGAGAAAGGI